MDKKDFNTVYKEVVQEIADAYETTPEELLSAQGDENIENLKNIAKWRMGISTPSNGEYRIRFVQRIPNYVDGVKPTIIECNTHDELFSHPLMVDFYKKFAPDFVKFEVDDDAVFAYFDNPTLPRWCCGLITEK